MASKEKTSYKYRGLALIIVNKDFKDPDMKRRGARKDLKMMKDLFTMLDFKVKAYLNLTATAMLTKIEKAKTWAHPDYDPECFVCVVSTHGEEAEVKGKKKGRRNTDSAWKPTVQGTDEVGLYVEDIIKNFADENCKAYRGKPKLFFIQACRVRLSPLHKVSERYDPGLEVLIQRMSLTDDKKHGAGDSRDFAAGNHDSESEAASARTGGQTDDFDEEIRELQTFYQGEELSDDEWDGQESEEEPESEESDTKHRHEQIKAGPSDEIDPKHRHESASGSKMIPVPNDIISLEIPQNCLLMVPVMSGKYAFRNSLLGSQMLRFMYEDKKMLLEGATLLQYLTRVCGAISQYEYMPVPAPDSMTDEVKAMLPCKMCACITHRLTDNITFDPREKKSWMAFFQKALKKLLQKVQ